MLTHMNFKSHAAMQLKSFMCLSSALVCTVYDSNAARIRILRHAGHHMIFDAIMTLEHAGKAELAEVVSQVRKPPGYFQIVWVGKCATDTQQWPAKCIIQSHPDDDHTVASVFDDLVTTL